MHRSPFITLLGVLALATTTLAAQQKPKVEQKPKETWATGEIERFDPSAGSVVIKQGTHEMTFALAPTAQIVEGTKTLQTSDLMTGAGRKVKVRYTMAGTTRTADRVEVAAATPAKTAASTPKKKTSK